MSSKLGTSYRKSPAVLVSYDYVDIAEKTGYTTYYGYNMSTSGATTYGLTRLQTFSQDIESSGASSAPYTIIKDLDFDLPFNITSIVNGTVRLNIPFHQTGGSASAYVFARIIKWDGSTETVLGDTCSKEIVSANTPMIINMEVDVAETKFTPDDTLRINLLLKGQANPAGEAAIYHDPQNRNGWKMTVGTDIGTTSFTARVPFLLDVA